MARLLFAGTAASDDPSRAALPFLGAVGWPNIGEVMREVADNGVPVYV